MQTFFRWLTYQQNREDDVGNIAKAIIKSRKEKPISSNFLEWYLFVDQLNSQRLRGEFIEAWEEYKTFIKLQHQK